jgi:hypothetical protein
MTREMDLGRNVGVGGAVVAPNHFLITIDPSDHERFVSYEEALLRELGDAAREHARDEGYRFLGPVTVELATDNVGPGVFHVAATVEEGPGGGPHAALVLGDGTRIELGEDPACIGRAEDCDVRLSDKNVSRRHAEVRREGGGFVLVDLDSTNGTRVNGARTKRRDLDDGDEITVGATTIRFETS